jgi:hypothetical protein
VCAVCRQRTLLARWPCGQRFGVGGIDRVTGLLLAQVHVRIDGPARRYWPPAAGGSVASVASVTIVTTRLAVAVSRHKAAKKPRAISQSDY